MKSFVITLISVAFLNGAVGMISPEGDIKKYVRFAGALCILAAIVSPIYFAVTDGGADIEKIFLENIFSEESYESEYESNLQKEGEKAVEDAIADSLCRDLGLDRDVFGVRVSISDDGEEYAIDGVEVVLYSSTVSEDPRNISAYVGKMTGCECSVIYEIK